MLVRAQEMARYVETGALDAGITGRDWVLETGADVCEVAETAVCQAESGAGALGAGRAGRSAECNRRAIWKAKSSPRKW